MQLLNKKMILVTAVLSMAFTGTAFAGDMADKAIGTWLRPNKGWHVEFSMCGEKLCGEVVSGEGTDKKTGKSVVGVKMLYDLEKDSDKRWKGKMYNPGDGNVYKGFVTVLSDNEVKMSGCMMGFMCRSEKWTRVVEEAPADMMEDAEGKADDMMDNAEDMADDMADDAEDMAEDMADDAEEAMEEATDGEKAE
ncbi:MAG: DUF2147 domain-containing protein [bacterium]